MGVGCHHELQRLGVSQASSAAAGEYFRRIMARSGVVEPEAHCERQLIKGLHTLC